MMLAIENKKEKTSKESVDFLACRLVPNKNRLNQHPSLFGYQKCAD
jgi:hypothetical protein